MVLAERTNHANKVARMGLVTSERWYLPTIFLGFMT